jgi:hypothetical protein
MRFLMLRSRVVRPNAATDGPRRVGRRAVAARSRVVEAAERVRERGKGSVAARSRGYIHFRPGRITNPSENRVRNGGKRDYARQRTTE